jgi:hypothetical protein
MALLIMLFILGDVMRTLHVVVHCTGTTGPYPQGPDAASVNTFRGRLDVIVDEWLGVRSFNISVEFDNPLSDSLQVCCC